MIRSQLINRVFHATQSLPHVMSEVPGMTDNDWADAMIHKHNITNEELWNEEGRLLNVQAETEYARDI